MFIENFMKDDMSVGIRMNNGEIEINLKDTCIGLGFTKTETKGGREYVSIRWDRALDYINDAYTFDHLWSKRAGDYRPISNLGDYIPEWVFFWLCLKASNNKAKKFQHWLSKEILPNLRKNGAVVDVSEGDSKDDVMQKLINAMKDANTKLAEENKILAADLAHFKEKANDNAKEVVIRDKMIDEKDEEINKAKEVTKKLIEDIVIGYCNLTSVTIPTEKGKWLKLINQTLDKFGIKGVILGDYFDI